MSSLRRRLTLTLIAALVAGGLAAGLGLYVQAIDETNEQFDSELRSVSGNVSVEALLHSGASLADGEAEDDDVVVQLWRPDGGLAYHSDEEIAPRPRLFHTAEVLPTANDRWYSYSRRLGDGRLLQVAQPDSARREIAAGLAFRLLVPLLVVVPLLAAFAAWMIAQQLRPVRELAARLAHRSPDDDSPITLPGLPAELAPMVAALNELFRRHAASAEQQRAFLAEAAHELRTPVAAVQLQAQRARRADNEAARHEAFTTLASGIDRLTRVVAQLLSLARSEVQAASANRQQVVQLDAKLKEWLAGLYPLAQAKRLDLGLSRADACQVLGDVNGLHSLVSNLLHNAIAFSPEGGQINVALCVAAGWAELTVTDSGPGIAPERREQMFQRFARGGDAPASGSGLGLAIVREQSIRHGGTVQLLDNPAGGGLQARVRLPLRIP